MVPRHRDSGHAEHDQAIHEHLADLGNLAVHSEHTGGGRVASFPGKVEHPGSVNQCPEPADGADDVQQDKNVEAHPGWRRVGAIT